MAIKWNWNDVWPPSSLDWSLHAIILILYICFFYELNFFQKFFKRSRIFFFRKRRHTLLTICVFTIIFYAMIIAPFQQFIKLKRFHNQWEKSIILQCFSNLSLMITIASIILWEWIILFDLKYQFHAFVSEATRLTDYRSIKDGMIRSTTMTDSVSLIGQGNDTLMQLQTQLSRYATDHFSVSESDSFSETLNNADAHFKNIWWINKRQLFGEPTATTCAVLVPFFTIYSTLQVVLLLHNELAAAILQYITIACLAAIYFACIQPISQCFDLTTVGHDLMIFGSGYSIAIIIYAIVLLIGAVFNNASMYYDPQISLALITFIFISFLHIFITSHIQRFQQNDINNQMQLQAKKPSTIRVVSKDQNDPDNPISLTNVIRHKRGYYMFMNYLLKEMCVENLLFVTEIEHFKNKFSLQNVITCTHSQTVSENNTNHHNSESSSHDSHNIHFDQPHTVHVSTAHKIFNKTPIMCETSFVKTIFLIYDTFIKTDSVYEINVSASMKKTFMQSEPVVQILAHPYDVEQATIEITPQNLTIFDDLHQEAFSLLADSFKRFKKTKRFRALERFFERQNRNSNSKTEKPIRKLGTFIRVGLES